MALLDPPVGGQPIANAGERLSDDHEFFSVRGKVALVTGASSGIGRILAARLAKQGSNVILAARRREKLEALKKEIEGFGKTAGQAVVVELDASASEDAIDKAVAASWSAFGHIDILVNNAGVFDGVEGAPQLTIDRPLSTWDLIYHTNVRGLGLVTKSVAKRMIAEQRPGSIINVSSAAGTERGVFPGSGIYESSKAAVIQLTKVYAIELGPHRIRVNALAPGVFPSEMGSAFIAAALPARKLVPVQRWGQADPDLTAPLLLLASDSGAYITGSTLVVDGGVTTQLPAFFRDPEEA